MESKYLINLSANASAPVKTGITLIRGDSGQTLAITVSGIDTSSTTAKIAFARPDGAVSVEADITATDGVYYYTLLGNELSVVGVVVADLKFYEGTKRISSAAFIFNVSADTMDGAHTPTGTVDKSDIEEWAETAATNGTLAESYAVGGTGTRTGEDTDNAKYYCRLAREIVGGDYLTRTEFGTFISSMVTVDESAETLIIDTSYVDDYVVDGGDSSDV